MDLKQFAIDAGVEIVRCDPDWGGTYGYKEQDYPNCVIAGFKSEDAAYKAWLEEKFGKHLAKAMQKLFKQTQKTRR